MTKTYSQYAVEVNRMGQIGHRGGQWEQVSVHALLSEAEKAAEELCKNGTGKIATEPNGDIPRGYFARDSMFTWSARIRGMDDVEISSN